MSLWLKGAYPDRKSWKDEPKLERPLDLQLAVELTHTRFRGAFLGWPEVRVTEALCERVVAAPAVNIVLCSVRPDQAHARELYARGRRLGKEVQCLLIRTFDSQTKRDRAPERVRELRMSSVRLT